MTIALGIILILASLFLIVAVLMQSSKSHRLSGTIAGGAETFFGKTKGSDLDKKLSKWTIVIAIVFVLAVLAVYLIQDTTVYDESDLIGSIDTAEPADTTEALDTTAGDAVTEAPAEETTGETVGE